MTLELCKDGDSLGYMTFIGYSLKEAVKKLKAEKDVRYVRGIEVYILNERFYRVKRVN